jgi:YfiH family protein
MNDFFKFLSPRWDVPKVKAFTILAHSQDNAEVTFSDKSSKGKLFRVQLEKIIKPKHPIFWMHQIHSGIVIELPNSKILEADGSYTSQSGVVCSVITADCLPIVFAKNDGTTVGVVHAGRKGLRKNIISNLVHKFKGKGTDISAWIGPGISQENYPVPNEVREEFIKLSNAYSVAFNKTTNENYYMNLNMIAIIQMELYGIRRNNIYGAEWDTFSDTKFHSFRRDSFRAGRMATVVWINENI